MGNELEEFAHGIYEGEVIDSIGHVIPVLMLSREVFTHLSVH